MKEFPNSDPARSAERGTDTRQRPARRGASKKPWHKPIYHEVDARTAQAHEDPSPFSDGDLYSDG